MDQRLQKRRERKREKARQRERALYHEDRDRGERKEREVHNW